MYAQRAAAQRRAKKKKKPLVDRGSSLEEAEGLLSSANSRRKWNQTGGNETVCIFVYFLFLFFVFGFSLRQHDYNNGDHVASACTETLA